MQRPCPLCGANEGFFQDRRNWASDSGICRACDQISSNAEIARGQPWTEAEIAQMLKRVSARN